MKLVGLIKMNEEREGGGEEARGLERSCLGSVVAGRASGLLSSLK
jgi:hypothetical protein